MNYTETLPSSNDGLMKVAFSPVYKYQLPPGHRFPMEKYELIPEQLRYEGTVSSDNFFHPESMPDHHILLTHTREYLEKLNSVSMTRREMRDIGFPVRAELIKRGKHIAQGTLDCAYHAMASGVALNVAGGTHHSYADRGEGFCVFNDMAIASNVLLHRGHSKRILIIDLDVHQGNGTAHIFRNESRVFTLSIHGERNYPLRKERSDMDIGLPDGTGDKLYLSTIKRVIPSVIQEFQPDFVFYLSGVDILGTDKLGRLKITKEGCKERDKFVFGQCKENQLPVAVSMGGGYSHKIADIVDAHCNTFRVAQEIFF